MLEKPNIMNPQDFMSKSSEFSILGQNSIQNNQSGNIFVNQLLMNSANFPASNVFMNKTPIFNSSVFIFFIIIAKFFLLNIRQ